MSSLRAEASDVSARPAMTWRPASWLLCFTERIRLSMALSTSPWMISSDVKLSWRPSNPAHNGDNTL